jgi:hypothetical protein
MEWAVLVAIIAILILPTYASTLIARAVAERVETRARKRAGLGESRDQRSRPQPIRAWVIFLLCPAVIILVMTAVLGVTIGMTRNYGPMKPFGTAWLFTSLAMVQLAASFVCASIWFDPPRGRRRCPSCWYEMPTGTELKCTECGKVAANERALHRTRRKPEFVRYAVLLVIVAPLVMRIGVWMEHGPTGFIPTTVLILGMEHLPAELIEHAPTSTVASASLLARQARRELFDWQEKLLQWKTRRILQSSTDLRVLGTAWQAMQRDRVSGPELTLPEENIRVLLQSLRAEDAMDRLNAAKVLLDVSGFRGELIDKPAPWQSIARELSDQIAPAILDDDANVAYAATIAAMTKPESARGVLEGLVKRIEGDTSMRRSDARTAGYLLAVIGGKLPEAAEAYMSLLESKNDKVRMTAADTVGSLLNERPDLIQRFVPVLSDPSPNVRLEFMTRLRHRFAPAVILPYLLKEMRTSPATSNSCPYLIREILGGENDVPNELREEVMKAFIEVIRDPMEAVSLRMAACEVFDSGVVPDDAVLQAMHAFAAERILREDSQEHLARIIKKHEDAAEAE